MRRQHLAWCCVLILRPLGAWVGRASGGGSHEHERPFNAARAGWALMAHYSAGLDAADEASVELELVPQHARVRQAQRKAQRGSASQPSRTLPNDDLVDNPIKWYLNSISKAKLLLPHEEISLASSIQAKVGLQDKQRDLAVLLGRVPTIDEVAAAISRPPSEVASLLREGERARELLLVSNLRLVVSSKCHDARAHARLPTTLPYISHSPGSCTDARSRKAVQKSGAAIRGHDTGMTRDSR